MIELTKYITEKLKLDKDIKVSSDSDTNTFVSLITAACHIPISSNGHWKNIVDKIEEWAIDNNLKTLGDVKIYVNLKTLKKEHFGLYDKMKDEGNLKVFREPDETLDEMILHAIKNVGELIAENTRNDEYGKLYKIGPKNMAYTLDYCHTYFYIEVK